MLKARCRLCSQGPLSLGPGAAYPVSHRVRPPSRSIVDNVTQITTLIFAAMAGIGSLIRCWQNRRMYRFQRKVHAKKLAKKNKDA